MNPPNAARRRVVVIGGGISGLAAAHRLIERDAALDVLLLEAGDRLGGVLHTVRRDGFLIEHSADSFTSDPPTAVDLCRRIGFGDELIPTASGSRGAFVVHRGALARIPEGFMLMAPRRLRPILQSPILSPLGKLRLLGEALVPRRKASSDESLAAFARRRLGREAFERIVQPLVAGIYTADPEKLSVRATLPRFIDMEQQHGSLIRAARRGSDAMAEAAEAEGGARYGLFVAPRDGMSSMVEAIARRLPPGAARLQSRVEALSRASDGSWHLRLAAPATSASIACDGLIVAARAGHAAALVESLDPSLASDLRGIPYAGTAIACLAYRREQIAHPLDGFGLVVPLVERRRILAASFSSIKFPGRAPEGTVLVRVFIGGACQAELLDLSDDAMRQIAVEELASLVAARGEPILADVARWPASMPQYHLGHCELVERIERAARQWPNFALAGNAFHGVGIPHCIKSGETAAEQVLAAIKSRL